MFSHQHECFYIQSLQLGWHPNAESEQVAGAMIKSKLQKEQFNGREKSGAAAGNIYLFVYFLLNNAAGEQFISSLLHCPTKSLTSQLRFTAAC